MKRILIVVLLMTGIILPGFSQEGSIDHCATDQYNHDLLQQDATAQHEKQAYLEALTAIAETPSDDALHKKKAVKTIPVVFHVIHTYGEENISKEQILDQLRVLNEDFRRLNDDRIDTRAVFQSRSADCEVEFALARIDPDGNCTDGITRTYSTLTDGGDDQVKSLIRWDPRKYLNIWVIKRIYYGGSDGTTLGYATFPYNFNATRDGIVIRADRVGTIGTAVTNGAGRTLTHEVGHYLGLYHTFQNGCGGSCSTSGDRVCDTPPVAEPSYGCPLGNNTCSNDNPNELDMVENFMDYANGNCMNAFTDGQKSVITFVLNNYRQILWSGSNLAATGVGATTTCAPVADFKIRDDEYRICAGDNITLEDLSWNGEVTDYEWTFTGGTPQVSTFKVPIVNYNQPGRYTIKLKVVNSAGTDTITKEQIVQVVPTTAEMKTPYTEDFENETEFNKDWIKTESRYGWQYSDVNYSGSGGLEARIDEETATGEDFYIQLPPVDMTAFAGLDPSFSFRCAYALPTSGSNGEFLYLEGSTDCGQNWRNAFVWLGRTTLKSTNLAQRNWEPQLVEEWQVLSVKLNKNGFESSKNLWLRFRARSNSGNSIYIDDIQIDRFALSVEDNAWVNRLTIYPNPSSGKFTISFSEGFDLGSVTVSDQLGRVVRTATRDDIVDGGVTFDELTQGIYFVRIADHDGNVHTQKIVITKEL